MRKFRANVPTDSSEHQADFKQRLYGSDTRLMRWFGEFRSGFSQDDDGRRTGRVFIESSLNCNIGRVLDLSHGGLRVMARRSPSADLVNVRLWDDAGGFETEARVAWRIRRGFLRHELGLALPPLDDVSLAFLMRVASRHRWKQTITDFDAKRDAA